MLSFFFAEKQKEAPRKYYAEEFFLKVKHNNL